MKYSILIAILLLTTSCTVVNNMIGYGSKFDRPVNSDCINRVIKNYKGVSAYQAQNNLVNFELNDYHIQFEYTVNNGLVSVYEITIDGMFLGEDLGVFYNNAASIQESLHKKIEATCQ